MVSIAVAAVILFNTVRLLTDALRQLAGTQKRAG